jgi:DNA-binding NtrC family response regulator
MKMNPSLPLLIVDDEEHILTGYDMVLRLSGYNNIISCSESKKVMDILHEKGAEVVLLDITMPYLTGDKLLPMIRQDFPDTQVVMITGNDDTETAVNCMKGGAFDYLVKPINKERLQTVVQKAISFGNITRENLQLKKHLLSVELEDPEAFGEIITANDSILSIFRYIEAICKTSQPVLVTGETGVGKELFAKAIHHASKREGPFIAVNIAGLDEQVFTDTLFGHCKGAYTGAEKNRQGMVEKASGGTLFLDEIGELDLRAQVKLLRLLQEQEYLPLGADIPKKTDVNIILATNREITELEDPKIFRKDLYFRLITHHIHIPPLRKRMDDLPFLLDYFLENVSHSLGKKKPRPSKEIIPLLASYHYPGNIRELQAMVTDSVTRHKSMMLSHDTLKDYIFKKQGDGMKKDEQNNEEAILFGDNLPTMNDAKMILIDEAMKRASGNKSLAAQMLKISRQAITWREKQNR